MENLSAGAGKFPINVAQFIGHNIMGFNRGDQIANGVNSELYARAFVFEKDGVLLATIVAEIWTCTKEIREALLAKIAESTVLNQIKPEHIMISGTHTHSGPAGISNYTLYSKMTGGYKPAVVNAIVMAMTSALEIATKGKRSAVLQYCRYDPAKETNEWFGNRSLDAYKANPESERNRHSGPRETALDVLLIKAAGNEFDLIGSLSWIAMHATALGPANDRFSSDIPGVAASIIEDKMRQKLNQNVETGSFVAGIVNSCCGDISPNLKVVDGGVEQKVRRDGNFVEEAVGVVGHVVALAAAALDILWGRKPDPKPLVVLTDDQTLTKVGRELGYALLKCHGDSTAMTREKVTGKIASALEYSDMAAWQGNGKRTWPGAIGLCTLAGATLDGPGPAGLREGIRDDDLGFGEDAILKAVRIISSKPLGAPAGSLGIGVDVLQWVQKSYGMEADPYVPSADYVAGHSPKPIAIMAPRVGPQILPVQSLRLGSIVIVGIPAEITTMAGRRLREQVEEALQKQERSTVRVLVTCYANDYSQYVTTTEEYRTQHYEGASTLFGPHTLDAYTDRARDLALRS